VSDPPPPPVVVLALDALPRIRLRTGIVGPHAALAYVSTARTVNSRRTAVLSLRRAAEILAPGSRETWRGDPSAADPIAREPVLFLPWHKLSPVHVQAIIAQLEHAGAKHSTVRLTWYHVRAVLRTAWRLGMYSDGELKRLDSLPKPGATRTAPGQWLGLIERQRLWQSCDPRTAKGIRDRMFLALADVHLLRRAECASLRLADLSQDRATFTATRKGGHRDRLSFTSQTRKILDAWLLLRGAWEGPLLCPITQTGIPIHRGLAPDALFRLLRRKTEELGIQRASPHDLRAGGITDLLAGGIDLALVAKLAGHSSTQTTQRYDRRGDAAMAVAGAARTIPLDIDDEE